MDSAEEKGLTREEDDSLRRLVWFADTVGVSKWARSRIDDLRGRDRRAEVRPPRDLPVAECAADILSRPEPPLTQSNEPVSEAVSETVSQAARQTASATGVRQTRGRRHPWSRLKGAKSS